MHICATEKKDKMFNVVFNDVLCVRNMTWWFYFYLIFNHEEQDGSVRVDS